MLLTTHDKRRRIPVRGFAHRERGPVARVDAVARHAVRQAAHGPLEPTAGGAGVTAGERHLAGHRAELVGVADQEQLRHHAVLDEHRADAVAVPGDHELDRRRPVEPDRLELERLRGDGGEEAEDLVAPEDRVERRLHLAAAVGHQHDVGGEHVHQPLQVARLGGRAEPLDHRVALGRADGRARAAARRRGPAPGWRSGAPRARTSRPPPRSRRTARRRPRAARRPPARSAAASPAPAASRSRRCRRARRPGPRQAR